MDYSLENLEQIVKLSASDDFIKLIIRNYLTIDPTRFKSSSELYELIYNQMRVDQKSIGKVNGEDKKKFLSELMQDYSLHGGNQSINPLAEQAGFFTFKSWNLLKTEKIHDKDMRHRLYINVNANGLMSLSNALYEELKNKNIPFYFKIQNNDYNEKGFKDSIVLYTSTEYLDDTIQALLNIERNNPSLIAQCNVPSELVGKINSWIGYASETEVVKHSYTSNVCIAVANAIERSVREWCINNRNVKIGNQTIDEYYHVSDNCMGLYDEMRIKTQVLVSNIPKVDSNFSKRLCEIAREEFIKVGLNPNNICMTDIARDEIQKYIEGLKSNISITNQAKEELQELKSLLGEMEQINARQSEIQQRINDLAKNNVNQQDNLDLDSEERQR